MSVVYSHELKKFADMGLQLRTPVDLVPQNQYSRLTNGLPVIEGQLRTRDGLTLITDVFTVAAISKLNRINLITTNATQAITINENGFSVGDVVTIIVTADSPTALSTITPGEYIVTVTARGFLSFEFTPGIPGTWNPAENEAPVFAQARSQAITTNLPITLINNIFRLNQLVPGISSDRLISMASRLYYASIPDGMAFNELALATTSGEPPSAQIGFSGRPLSIISFRFTLDEPAWAIIADENIMCKFREDVGQIYFFHLGNPPPLVPATATDGGAGNLNSTGGTPFDWRYTYYDGIVGTEGNPSDIMNPGPADTKRPTLFTNPDPAVTGSTAITNPANAIDGSDVTFATVTGHVDVTLEESDAGPGKPTHRVVTSNIESCLYRGIANPATPPTSDVTLNVTYDVTITGTGGTVGGSVSYSVDSGTSYTAMFTKSSNQVKTTATVILPLGVDFTAVRVRVRSTVSGGGSADTERDVVFKVYDINLQVTQTAPGLALVAKKANVCVQLPTVNDGRITAIRLYRRGGSLTDNWRLVSETPLSTITAGGCGAGFGQIVDNISDTTLSTQPILEFDNDEPVTSVSNKAQPLTFIWGPVGLDARVLGCGDPGRPESVYFSKPGNPDAWPPQNHIEVSEPGTPIIAGCVFNTQSFAFSRERIYQLVEGYLPGNVFVPFVTPSARGLFTPWGLTTGQAMYFISKDGIYETTGGIETSIVENDIKPIFPTYDGIAGRDVEGYEAVDYSQPDNMRLVFHNNELYFLYVGLTTGVRQLLVYDVLKRRWRNATYTTGMSTAYSEPSTVSSLLFGTNAGAFYETGGESDPVELDVIENAILRSDTAFPITLLANLYDAQMVRYGPDGAAAASNLKSQITVDATHGIGVVFPAGPPGTVKWRVYWNTNGSPLNQYLELTEAQVAALANRTTVIVDLGVAGSPPTANANPNIQVVIRTGAHDQGAPLNRKQYGNVIFDLDPGGATVGAPVTITPYIDGERQAEAAIAVVGSGRMQVPLDLSDFFAFNTEYEIAWQRTPIATDVFSDPLLFQYDTLHFLEPAGVTHWEAQPTSFGFPGFVHLRDAYIAIRSTDLVTLTLTIDGTTVQTYEVPSTGGERQKVYVQFAPNKGKLYQLALDGVSHGESQQDTFEFRVYADDLEVRVKPWLGVLGYSVQRTLGGETA